MRAADGEPKHGNTVCLVDVEVNRAYYSTSEDHREGRALAPRIRNISRDECLGVPPREW